MADTEKLTLAVDIEIAKHDLLLDRFVTEVELRVEASAGQRAAQAEHEGLSKQHATLQAEHAEMKRTLERVTEGLKRSEERYRVILSDNQKAEPLISALYRAADNLTIFISKESPKHTKAGIIELATKLRDAMNAASDHVDQIPF